jgi:hypothetical protein
MKVILTEGARTQSVIPWDGGYQAWQRAKVITYMEAPCTFAEAQAHLDTYEDGCVVLTKRGPKGGWTRLSFVIALSAVYVMSFERRGITMHLGRMTPKNYGQMSLELV